MINFEAPNVTAVLDAITAKFNTTYSLTIKPILNSYGFDLSIGSVGSERNAGIHGSIRFGDSHEPVFEMSLYNRSEYHQTFTKQGRIKTIAAAKAALGVIEEMYSGELEAAALKDLQAIQDTRSARIAETEANLNSKKLKLTSETASELLDAMIAKVKAMKPIQYRHTTTYPEISIDIYSVGDQGQVTNHTIIVRDEKKDDIKLEVDYCFELKKDIIAMLEDGWVDNAPASQYLAQTEQVESQG